MIDASKGFIKDGNKNRLREQDIRKIVDCFNGLIEIPKYSRMIPYSEIEANEFNLNIPRYIDSSEPEDLQDISAHLSGGIPRTDIDALESYWMVFPSLRTELFKDNDRDGYMELKVSKDNIRRPYTIILNLQGLLRELREHLMSGKRTTGLGLMKLIVENIQSSLLKISQKLT